MKFTGPEEIYKELVEESEESWLHGLMAFAVIEEQKIEWMRHEEKSIGSLPNSNEIRTWYEQQPSGVLLRAKDTAEARLTDYAQISIDEYSSEFQKEIEESIIVAEIRELKAFWPQFGVNLAGGFVSAILFGVLLIIVAFFVINDTSPVEVGTQLRNQVEENPSG